MISESYVRKAVVRSVVDGDTIEVMVDMGYKRYSIERIRVNRIDTPETRGIEREAGLVSKEFVKNLLPVGKEIMIQSYKGDAFGRWLGEVYFMNELDEQINLSDLLLEKGLAQIYEG